MGNAILCRNAPCTQPRPVYKTVLQQIFQIAVEKPKAEPGSTKNSTIDNNETATSKTSPEQIDVPKLQAHVKSHIKGLIDYLEGSHNKLIDTGNYLHKVVTGSFNPDIHMLGLLVIIELLDASSKFTHDKNFLAKLHQRTGNDAEESAKGENKSQKKASKDLDNSSFLEYGQTLRSNLLQFEDNVVEILSFLLDGKRNPFRKSSYRHVLIALNLFAQNHFGTVSPEKGEAILKDALEMIETYQQWNEKETLEVQSQFMELVVTMTKTSNVAFKFKQKFINHICSTLKMCYEQNSENNLLSSKTDPEIKAIKDRIINLAFDGITALTQSVYDLNEFGIMVTPLFNFFDNIEWKSEKLQTDIFISLIESMNQTSFEQVEIFFIDKIVEYVDHDPTNNPYKHNNDIGVKIRMFSLLGTIFERAKKTFLSFLIIDNITLSFLNNLRDHYTLGEEGKQLKEAIYNCHRQFIEKIDRSSKNLSQMLSSIAAQTLSAAFKDSKDEHFISAALEFFDFTLDEISHFPSQYFIQKECMIGLIRIRSIHEHSAKAYRCIEKLLATRCTNEAEGASPKYKRMESRKTELLTCPPDLVYSMLSNNLSVIKEVLEHPAEHSNIDFLKFILHCVKINTSLILRKDTITLMILLAYIKKIIELAMRENMKNPNRGLLFYIVSNFFRQLQTEWNIDPISSPRTLSPQIQPFITLDFMQKENDISNQESQKILHELEEFDIKKAENYEKEFNMCIETTLTHMKTLTSASTFENLNTDFDDLGSQYGGNAFISIIDDGDSHRIEPSVDHNNRSHLTDATPKPSYYQQGQQSQKRGGNKQVSLISIGQIRDQNSVMKTSQIKQEGGQQEESDPSSFIDKSFENALKEAKKNKAKPNNLTKILNNQI